MNLDDREEKKDLSKEDQKLVKKLEKKRQKLFKSSNKKGFIKTYISGGIRALVVLIMLFAQFSLLFWISWVASMYGVVIYYVSSLITALIITVLVNKNSIPSFKIGWLIVIVLIPYSGLFMYLLWGNNVDTKRIRQKNFSHIEYSYKFVDDCTKELSELSSQDYYSGKIAKYLANNHFPLLKGNKIDYFPLGEDAFESIIEDFENAEKFIFLDFFIVADGYLWRSIKDILIQKAQEGVEIKFLYDDYGSMFRTSKAFWKELNNAGIETAEFNPITKYLDRLYLNYRSHQKIVIIDGKIGYTGGFNLADEYVNQLERFGVWKDNAVRIEGNGVYGLTLTFLSMWGLCKHKNIDDFKKYRYQFNSNELSNLDNNSYVQIISDGPENNPSNPAADVIKQLVYSARDYLYITTPYLIPESDMADSLINAAQSGIDVKIIVPGIPDKKIVNLLTKYNYGKLLKGGVKIYEYTPGFIHAKTYITKGYGMVGTINLDYRSLYLHYECAAFMWDDNVIQKTYEDLNDTIEQCHEITYDEWKHRPWYQKVAQPVINLFASLL